MLSHNEKYQELLRQENYLEVINSFTKSLLFAETVNEIIWCVTDNAISKMNYQDCVIYLEDENSDNLIQRSAFGPKASGLQEIKNPFIIAKGRGIVGAVFSSGIGEIIDDTSKDSRYVQDDALRLSEITIPIILEGKVIGVIDSEHSDIGFFTHSDFEILTTISNLIASKIKQVKTNEKYKDDLEKAVILKTKKLAEINNKLKIQNAEKEVLIKEIHHRVKNNMQIIISLLGMHIHESKTESEKRVFKECSDRMHAIANVHGKIYFDKNVLKINIQEFIYELSSELIASYYKKKQIDLELDINVKEVSLDIAIPIGLVINEMITITINNKVGCQKSEKVLITMAEFEDYYTVKYKDETNGYNLEDSDSFFGIQLVDLLKDQLDANLNITATELILDIPKD